jgi:hypothetical protein
VSSWATQFLQTHTIRKKTGNSREITERRNGSFRNYERERERQRERRRDRDREPA